MSTKAIDPFTRQCPGDALLAGIKLALTTFVSLIGSVVCEAGMDTSASAAHAAAAVNSVVVNVATSGVAEPPPHAFKAKSLDNIATTNLVYDFLSPGINSLNLGQ